MLSVLLYFLISLRQLFIQFKNSHILTLLHMWLIHRHYYYIITLIMHSSTLAGDFIFDLIITKFTYHSLFSSDFIYSSSLLITQWYSSHATSTLTNIKPISLHLTIEIIGGIHITCIFIITRRFRWTIYFTFRCTLTYIMHVPWFTLITIVIADVLY